MITTKPIYYLQFKDFWRLVSIPQEQANLNSFLITNPQDIIYTITQYPFRCFLAQALLYSKNNYSLYLSRVNNIQESEIIRNLIGNYIMPSMWDKYVVRTSNNEIKYNTIAHVLTNEATNKDLENFIFESMAFIEETYPYYSKMLSLYSAQEDELLNDLGYTETITTSNSNTETRNLSGSDNNTETRNLVGTDDNIQTRNATDTLAYNNEQEHSVDKFNDMPQTENVATDSHLTNIRDITNSKSGGHSTTLGGTITDNRDTTETGTIGNVRSTTDTGTIANNGQALNSISHVNNVEIMERLKLIQESYRRLYSEWAKEYERRFAITLRED